MKFDENNVGEGIHVHLAEGMKEAVVRFGDAPEQLKELAPRQLNIGGTLGAVYEFLSKRHDCPDQINQKKCHIIVAREEVKIMLVTHEDDERLVNRITGTLQLNPKFQSFNLNEMGGAWKPNDLGRFFKMNRSYFPDIKCNRELVTALMHFQGDVQAQYQQKKDQSDGSFADCVSGVVTTNLPQTFQLRMPIFKGGAVETFEVEFYAQVNGREIYLSMMSPEILQVFEESRDKLIDEQITAIRALCPDIAIIEV